MKLSVTQEKIFDRIMVWLREGGYIPMGDHGDLEFIRKSDACAETFLDVAQAMQGMLAFGSTQNRNELYISTASYAIAKAKRKGN